MSGLLEQAKAIVASGPNTTYPSRAAANHVRTVMRALLDMVERHQREDEARADDEALWT